MKLDGHIRWANDALCQMLRYSLDELAGKHFKEVTVQTDVDADARAFERLVNQGLAYGLFKHWVQRGGSGLIAGDLRVVPHREMNEVVVAIGYVLPAEQAKAMIEGVVGALVQEGKMNLPNAQPAFDPQKFMKKWWPLITALITLQGSIIGASILFVMSLRG